MEPVRSFPKMDLVVTVVLPRTGFVGAHSIGLAGPGEVVDAHFRNAHSALRREADVAYRVPVQRNSRSGRCEPGFVLRRSAYKVALVVQSDRIDQILFRSECRLMKG